jgi:aspartate/methionine/tyrosine aminotransferase
VLLSNWEYAPVPGILRDHNLVETRVAVKEDLSIDIEDLQKKVENDSVFYISMPNNPTGYFSPGDLKTIAATLSAKNGAVIWDAPYLFTVLKIDGNHADFDRSFLKKKIEELKKIAEKYHEHLCILSSLSKTCLIAGLRFGFATACKQWIDNMNAILGRENLSSPTSSFIIGAAILRRFLETPLSHEWLCDALANRLTILMEEIPDHLMLPRNGMFGALYVLIKMREEAQAAANQLINEHGIVAIPGTQFYGGLTNAVRLSLVSVPWSEGDEAWIEGVRTLRKALATKA